MIYFIFYISKDAHFFKDNKLILPSDILLDIVNDRLIHLAALVSAFRMKLVEEVWKSFYENYNLIYNNFNNE